MESPILLDVKGLGLAGVEFSLGTFAELITSLAARQIAFEFFIDGKSTLNNFQDGKALASQLQRHLSLGLSPDYDLEVSTISQLFPSERDGLLIVGRCGAKVS